MFDAVRKVVYTKIENGDDSIAYLDGAFDENNHYSGVDKYSVEDITVVWNAKKDEWLELDPRQVFSEGDDDVTAITLRYSPEATAKYGGQGLGYPSSVFVQEHVPSPRIVLAIPRKMFTNIPINKRGFMTVLLPKGDD